DVTKDIGKETAETTPKTTLKTTLKIDGEILSIIKKDPEIRKEQLAKVFNMTVDGIKYHMRILRKKGIIKWSGSSKLGHWEILESEK
ncbi:MAG: winged helix-turn-helix domain-containing protein, partial [Candidatus Omnitrophica bacterium]|nr:winged helix-turn-helix domain-containing protein [Candidatus Omnitrophota bacterium]